MSLWITVQTLLDGSLARSRPGYRTTALVISAVIALMLVIEFFGLESKMAGTYTCVHPVTRTYHQRIVNIFGVSGNGYLFPESYAACFFYMMYKEKQSWSSYTSVIWEETDLHREGSTREGSPQYSIEKSKRR